MQFITYFLVAIGCLESAYSTFAILYTLLLPLLLARMSRDFICINGTKFLVCDPTYIGAPIGMMMPDMDNKAVKGIVL